MTAPPCKPHLRQRVGARQTLQVPTGNRGRQAPSHKRQASRMATWDVLPKRDRASWRACQLFVAMQCLNPPAGDDKSSECHAWT